MTFDATRFPLAAQYIKSLPRGLDSHPECQVRADVAEPHVRELSRIASLTGLPKPLETFFAGPPAGQKWVSEVVFQAANLVLRDAGFPTETGFLQWSYDISAELFDKPLVRTLMRLMSPTLVIVGATKRWGTFHRGSELRPGTIAESKGRVLAQAELSYPAALFPPLFFRCLEQSFQAALDGSRAKDVQIVTVDVTPTSARFRVSFAS